MTDRYKNENQFLRSYRAKNGKKVIQSMQHPGLWIIEPETGGFYTINCVTEVMLKMNPPDLLEWSRLISEYPYLARLRDKIEGKPERPEPVPN